MPVSNRADGSPSKKTSVLFVCLGNICRSTMAEGVFRSVSRGHAGVGEIDSCGTGSYHTDDPPDERTLETLRDHGITDYEHAARQITLDDFDGRFDYIFAMDEHNLRDLLKLQRRAAKKGTADTGSGSGTAPGPAPAAKVMMLGEFHGRGGKGSGEAEEVMDPYYGADGGFDTVYEQVKRFSENFLAEVVEGGHR